MFKINQVCYDRVAKEYVLITNGIPDNNFFIPTEAIAIRVVGESQNGWFIMGYTYREVDPKDLDEVLGPSLCGSIKACFDKVLAGGKMQECHLVGRL